MADMDLVLLKRGQAVQLEQSIDAIVYSIAAMGAASKNLGLLAKEMEQKGTAEIVLATIEGNRQWVEIEEVRVLDLYKRLHLIEREIAMLEKGPDA